MSKLIIPEDYKPILDMGDTQLAIKKVKEYFQQELAHFLILRKTTAPVFVTAESGLNDPADSDDAKARFTLKKMNNKQVELIRSLSKWKRTILNKFDVEPGLGIYSEMRAIREDEEPDNLHSIFVDQWGWEKVITKEERTEEFLIKTVKTVYEVFKVLESFVMKQYSEIYLGMPEEIFIISAQELEDMYPDKTPDERVEEITRENRAVFISKIGSKMRSGERHGQKASDCEDWELNGIIAVWSDVLECAVPLTTMGIRVDEEALLKQLEEANLTDRKELDFHKKVLNNELPYTIGGEIGQSRLCMYFLKKAHIGEVQVSIWPEEMVKECEEHGIVLL